MASIHGKAPAGAIVRLVRADGSAPRMETTAAGTFRFQDVSHGWYIVSASIGLSREVAKPVHVGDNPVDIGTLTPHSVFGRFSFLTRPGPPSVVTVCEALEQRDQFDGMPLVIVGVYKSGMDETLRLDCPFELTLGKIGFPASIGLTQTDLAPDQLRDQVERKRQEILSSAPPEAPLRPERVVGLYGRLVSLAGLSKATCCHAAVKTIYPPARLIGTYTDYRVIR